MTDEQKELGLQEEEVQEVQEVVQPKGRRKKNTNPNNKNNQGEEVGTKIPGRPLGSNVKLEKRDVKEQEVFFQTPNGILCKKIYEIYYTRNGRYRRLKQVLKNVKG